jgi:type IV secretion system protein VirD4
MTQDARAVPWNAMEPDPRDELRIVLGRVGGKLYAAEAFRPILVLGQERSRKTTALAVPSVLEWPGPVVTTSIGMDVVEQSLEARRRVGEVMIFDPGEVMVGWPERVGWSPLDQVITWDDAKSVARGLTAAGTRAFPAARSDLTGAVDTNFWYTAAAKLLAPHLFAAAKNGYTMSDVMRWILTQEEFEVRSLLQAAGDDFAIREADASWQREERARSSVYTTLEIALDIWARRSLQDASGAEPRFHLEQFLDGRANTLYVCAPPAEQQEYLPALTGLISMIIRRAYQINHGFSSISLGLRGTTAALDASSGRITPLLLVLDDAGSVAPLLELGSLASTAGKAAVQLVTVFNDLSQMEAIYGDRVARSVVNNHAAVLVMPGSHDPATADLVDMMLRDESVFDSPGAVPSSVLRRLPHGTALCVYDNLPPRLIDLRSSSTDGDLLARRGLEGAVGDLHGQAPG